MTPLTTERLVLRPVARDDLPDVLTLAGEAAVAELTCAIPSPLSAADVETWLASCTREDQRTFAIVRAADKVFLGVMTLMLGGDDRPAQLGYWIGRPYWGQGYATEAVRRLLRFAFGERKLSSVEAVVFPGNDASVRVLVKTGFHETERAKRLAPARGGERDVIVFVATRASFAQAALSQAVGRT